MLEAGVPTPESMNRDKSVRRKRKFYNAVNEVEDTGPGRIRYFLEHADEDYGVTRERWMPGVFVANWPE